MLPSMQSIRGQISKQIVMVLLKEFSRSGELQGFSVRLWDGTLIQPDGKSDFTLVIRKPDALRSLLETPNELTLGEAFIRSDLDVEGDFDAALAFAEQLIARGSDSSHKIAHHLLADVLPPASEKPRTRDPQDDQALHSRESDRAAIARHYDVSNEFYQLWLDRNMMYSCAYFESPDESLDIAQTRKLDYICRKLRIRPGDKLLDIGCGWGGLIMHAASQYGAYACGITLSARQAELASERIASAGLSDRCAVRLCDYRDAEGEEEYDKISSIGMVEHVGESMLGTYFRQAWRLLRPGGVFLNSGIAASATYSRKGPSFMDTYVFPDGELVPLNRMLRESEECGFEIQDVESLREHYALTLDRWVRGLELNAAEAKNTTDEITYRIWKLYMIASTRAFRSGRINIYHTLLQKPDRSKQEAPLTRQDWYAPELQPKAPRAA
jgi:cyclopropane-fatty-acyl-phospholipid synthase